MQYYWKRTRSLSLVTEGPHSSPWTLHPVHVALRNSENPTGGTARAHQVESGQVPAWSPLPPVARVRDGGKEGAVCWEEGRGPEEAGRWGSQQRCWGVFSPWNKDRLDFVPGLSCGPCTLSNQHTGSLRCTCAFKMSCPGTSLLVRWLRLWASTPVGTGSAPGWESSMCPTVWPKRKKKKEREVKFFL